YNGPGHASEATLEPPSDPSSEASDPRTTASGNVVVRPGVAVLARSVRFMAGFPRTPAGSRSPLESPARMADGAPIDRQGQPTYPPSRPTAENSWKTVGRGRLGAGAGPDWAAERAPQDRK